MHGLLRTAFCAALSCAPTALLASSVYRCEDAGGHITFTSQGCPTEHAQTVQNADNPRPGTGKPVQMAKPSRSNREDKNSRARKPDELVVVGVPDDGCGNRVVANARRTAMINKEVRAGMTLADVESTLGKPDQISSQNGQLRYQYRSKEGRSRAVSFDENGCVKGK